MYMTTSIGRAVYLPPNVEDISIVDIANALGNLCRFGGHILDGKFYSVAEHSVQVMLQFQRSFPDAPREYVLYALLHDGPETYIQDMIRPVKAHITGYNELDMRTDFTIRQRYGIGEDIVWRKRVLDSDNEVLAAEEFTVAGRHVVPWGLPYKPAHLFEANFYPPEKARNLFLNAFCHLQGH